MTAAAEENGEISPFLTKLLLLVLRHLRSGPGGRPAARLNVRPADTPLAERGGAEGIIHRCESPPPREERSLQGTRTPDPDVCPHSLRLLASTNLGCRGAAASPRRPLRQQ